MLDAEGTVLYVGKAKDLKRRVSSYFGRALNRRLVVMVAQIADIQVTVTRTEGEALLLENNLIKEHKPRFNVLLRDDKSYPYLSAHRHCDAFRAGLLPRSRAGGTLLRPLSQRLGVRETLQLLQKLFPVRQCEDTFYSTRSRPCLQYQIKRCTAPCVGFISPKDYAWTWSTASSSWRGAPTRSSASWAQRMEQAAEALEFERAARLRDQISTLRRIQQRQYVTGDGGDLDIVAAAEEGGSVCVQVFFIRAGRNLGNKAFFPQVPDAAGPESVLSAFLAQFYADKEVPPEILTSAEPDEREFLEAAFSEQAGRRVAIRHRLRGDRARWLDMARDNAELALKSRLGSRAGYARRLEALRDLLDLDELPTPHGVLRHQPHPRRADRGLLRGVRRRGAAQVRLSALQHRRHHPRRRLRRHGAGPGRRYRRVQQGEVPMPDLLFIDGGKGQLGAVAGRAAGTRHHRPAAGGRRQGAGPQGRRRAALAAGARDADHRRRRLAGLHLVQQIRDEAHRFAITGHRQRRDKARRTSVLEDPRRRP
jgi:excinuclease ABC subunit C